MSVRSNKITKKKHKKPFSYSPEEITYSEWKRKLLKLNRSLVCVCLYVCAQECVIGVFNSKKATKTNLVTWLDVKIPNCVNVHMSWRLDNTDICAIFHSFLLLLLNIFRLNIPLVYGDTARIFVCVSVTNGNPQIGISQFSLSSKPHKPTDTHTHTIHRPEYNYGPYNIFEAMIYRYNFCLVVVVQNWKFINGLNEKQQQPTTADEENHRSCFHNFVVFFLSLFIFV